MTSSFSGSESSGEENRSTLANIASRSSAERRSSSEPSPDKSALNALSIPPLTSRRSCAAISQDIPSSSPRRLSSLSYSCFACSTVLSRSAGSLLPFTSSIFSIASCTRWQSSSRFSEYTCSPVRCMSISARSSSSAGNCFNLQSFVRILARNAEASPHLR